MWHKYSNYMIYLNHDHESLQLDMSLLCFGTSPQNFLYPIANHASEFEGNYTSALFTIAIPTHLYFYTSYI